MCPVESRKPDSGSKRRPALFKDLRISAFLSSKRVSATESALLCADPKQEQRPSAAAGKPTRERPHDQRIGARQAELRSSVAGHLTPPPPKLAEESVESHPLRRISAREVRGICGISNQTLWRWLNDRKLNFPQPVRVNGRRFWSVADVIAWWHRRSTQVDGEDAA